MQFLENFLCMDLSFILKDPLMYSLKNNETNWLLQIMRKYLKCV